jgi:hypothetical protein
MLFNNLHKEFWTASRWQAVEKEVERKPEKSSTRESTACDNGIKNALKETQPNTPILTESSGVSISEGASRFGSFDRALYEQ